MAKQTGLGDLLLVAEYDLSGDTQAINSAGGGPAVLDFTAINQSAMDRLGGVRDGRLEATSFFNPDTDRAHPVLSALPTADRVMSYARGGTLGAAVASIVAKQLNYDGTRGQAGEFTFAVTGEANGFGLQWGELATAGIHDSTGAEDLAQIDGGVSTSFGLQAFLHVTEFTGTSATVKLQDSTGGPWQDIPGAAFSTVTAATSERLATSATETVDRYVRVSIAGTFTTMSLAVSVVRNDTATEF